MSDPIFVPSDLLDALDRKISAEMPALERRIVTAYVLAGGGPASAWATAVTLKAAAALWPANIARRPVRNVLTVLLELEQLEVLTDVVPCEGGYSVESE